MYRNFTYNVSQAHRAMMFPGTADKFIRQLAENWTPYTTSTEFFDVISTYFDITGETACEIFHEVLDFVENTPVDPTKDPRVINVGFYDADGVYFTTWEARRGYTENLGCANTWSFAPTHVQYWCEGRVKEVPYEDFPNTMGW